MARANKVTWNKGGRWCFTKMVDGKRKAFYASPEIPNTPAGKRKATEWMEGMLRSLEDRVVTDQDWMLGDLRLAYLTWCKHRVAEGEAKHHTFDGHRKRLNLICRTKRNGKPIGRMLVRDLDRATLSEIIKLWGPKSATTIRNRVGTLQAMLNWAASSRTDRAIEQLIPVNPIVGFELPKAEYQGDRYASAEEILAFLRWVDAKAMQATGFVARFERMTALLIRVIAETGARPGELCALEWRHFDSTNHVIVLPPKEHKTGGKTKKPRLILLSPQLSASISWLRSHPDHHPTHVFTHKTRRLGSTPEERRRGDPWDSGHLSRRVKTLRRNAIAAGVPLKDVGVKRMHLYRLRHSHITEAMQSPEKPSITDVAALHGTSSKMIESTYLHHQVDYLREVQERISRSQRLNDHPE